VFCREARSLFKEGEVLTMQTQKSLVKTIIHEEADSKTVLEIIKSRASDLKISKELFAVRINGKKAFLNSLVSQDDVLQIIPIFSGGK